MSVCVFVSVVARAEGLRCVPPRDPAAIGSALPWFKSLVMIPTATAAAMCHHTTTLRQQQHEHQHQLRRQRSTSTTRHTDNGSTTAKSPTTQNTNNVNSNSNSAKTTATTTNNGDNNNNNNNNGNHNHTRHLLAVCRVEVNKLRTLQYNLDARLDLVRLEAMVRLSLCPAGHRAKAEGGGCLALTRSLFLVCAVDAQSAL